MRQFLVVMGGWTRNACKYISMSLSEILQNIHYDKVIRAQIFDLKLK